MQKKVFIIDDHKMVIDGLRMIIQSDNRLQYVGSAIHCDDAEKRISQLPVKPDILLCDYRMPNCTGLDLMKRLKNLGFNFKYIILTMIMEGRVIRECWDAGCDGFLGKNVGAEELLNAIQKVFNGERYISREQSFLLKEKPAMQAQQDLSKRELEIIENMLVGLSSKEIAENLSISKRTVDNHRQNILKKTQSKNTAELINKYRSL